MEDQETQLLLQREIISKERTIFEIEKKWTIANNEIVKLKNERERLL